jgi:hypothetical protein
MRAVVLGDVGERRLLKRRGRRQGLVWRCKA